MRKAQTPEGRAKWIRLSMEGRKGRFSDIVRKQWESIRKDPEQLKRLLEKRKASMQRVWANMPEEEKNRRVKAWFSSHSRARSKGNELLKSMMQEAGLYGGFVSEQMFHGYVPDEINHELKIVVEYFGDIYHCNPRHYQDESQFVKAIGRTVGEQWARDRKRLGVFYQCGYSAVIVWERDFRNSPKREIERVRDEIDAKRKSTGVV